MKILKFVLWVCWYTLLHESIYDGMEMGFRMVYNIFDGALMGCNGLMYYAHGITMSAYCWYFFGVGIL